MVLGDLRGRLPLSDVRRAVLAVLVARTAINGGVRVVYPFLPAIERGLGVTAATMALLVALRSLAGMAAPVVPGVVERVGRRALMLGASAALVAGCLLVAAGPALDGRGQAGRLGLPLAVAGFVVIGLAKPAFDVPMQGWFGDRVPYARRGRVLGVTELTWALSLLVTVPLSGLLIPRFGWQAPFVLVAALGLVGLGAVRAGIASDRPAERVRRPLQLTGQRVRVLAVVLLFTAAAEQLFVVYGRWLEGDIGLSVTGIGVFTLVVVAAELAGEGGVAAFADRLGLRRTVLLGLVCSAAAYASLGAVGTSLAAAVAVVVAWFTAFEMTIVATVPLVSELAAESRDRLLSLLVATTAAGRGLGALAAPVAYDLGGIGGNGLVAAGLALLAALLLRGVAEPAHPVPPVTAGR